MDYLRGILDGVDPDRVIRGGFKCLIDHCQNYIPFGLYYLNNNTFGNLDSLENCVKKLGEPVEHYHNKFEECKRQVSINVSNLISIKTHTHELTRNIVVPELRIPLPPQSQPMTSPMVGSAQYEFNLPRPPISFTLRSTLNIPLTQATQLLPQRMPLYSTKGVEVLQQDIGTSQSLFMIGRDHYFIDSHSHLDMLAIGKYCDLENIDEQCYYKMPKGFKGCISNLVKPRYYNPQISSAFAKRKFDMIINSSIALGHTIGCHPKDFDLFDLEQMNKFIDFMIQQNKFLGIGECGFDDMG